MSEATGRRGRIRARMTGIFCAGTIFCMVMMARGAVAHAQGAEAKSAEEKPDARVYETIYLTNLTQSNDANDVSTALRNMLPKAAIYYVQSQAALTLHASPEDIAVAKRMVADLDKVQKVYRVTYTITDLDGDKQMGKQLYSMMVASGDRTTLKEGIRTPIVTGMYDAEKSTANSQVQYQDVGLSIEASLNGYMEGLRLRTKIEQTGMADEKSGVGPQDPVVRQSVLDGTATLTQGKPLMLGSFDVPGSTRRESIEVVAELVK
jgi:type II secretory pathway component GspD/PulD (secretin)